MEMNIKMNITWQSFNIGQDDLFTALYITRPNGLYDQLDFDIKIPDKYIDLAHHYYFGYNLPDINDQFLNLLSLIPGGQFSPITDNTTAKDEYFRLYQDKFIETNPDLKKIINEQKQLAHPGSQLLRSETTKFLLSLDPNADLLKLKSPFSEQVKNGVWIINNLIREQT